MGERELKQISDEIEAYQEILKHEPSNIDDLKDMLNNITNIKNQSMNMEFRISDFTEKFRTLEMY